MLVIANYVHEYLIYPLIEERRGMCHFQIDCTIGHRQLQPLLLFDYLTESTRNIKCHAN